MSSIKWASILVDGNIFLSRQYKSSKWQYYKCVCVLGFFGCFPSPRCYPELYDNRSHGRRWSRVNFVTLAQWGHLRFSRLNHAYSETPPPYMVMDSCLLRKSKINPHVWQETTTFVCGEHMSGVYIQPNVWRSTSTFKFKYAFCFR